jgi:hypothetical protein
MKESEGGRREVFLREAKTLGLAAGEAVWHS